MIQYIWPAFRCLVAKKLIDEYNFTQVATSEKLGTTQAAISYYLSSKRGKKYIKQLEKNSQVMSLVKEITKEIAVEAISPEEVVGKLCDLCMSLRNNVDVDLLSTLT